MAQNQLSELDTFFICTRCHQRVTDAGKAIERNGRTLIIHAGCEGILIPLQEYIIMNIAMNRRK